MLPNNANTITNSAHAKRNASSAIGVSKQNASSAISDELAISGASSIPIGISKQNAPAAIRYSICYPVYKFVCYALPLEPDTNTGSSRTNAYAICNANFYM